MVRKTQSRKNPVSYGFDGDYRAASHRSEAGAPSFNQPIELSTLQNLLCNTAEPSFYVAAGTLVEQSYVLYAKMVKEDPMLFAQMLVYARNEGYMRLQPVLGLVFLSKHAPDLFAKAFEYVVRTPNDLIDFINLCKAGNVRQGLGRQVKRVINNWFKTRTSEYWAIKYRDQLRLASKLTHFNPEALPVGAGKRKIVEIFDYLHDYNKKGGSGYPTESVVPQIAALEKLKHVTSPHAILTLIKEGRLPYETVTGIVKPERDGWRALVYQMPYFALLRHLAALERAGVFDESAVVEYVADYLTNSGAIAKAKILPFRFYTAWQHAPPVLRPAVEKALEISFENMPAIKGRVVVGTDVSGSMGNYPEAFQGVYRYIEIAAILTAACYKANPEGTIVIPFDVKAYRCDMSEFATIMEAVQWFARIRGGATDLGTPLNAMRYNKIEADTFIGITDNEDWAGHGVAKDLREYREEINPDLKAVLVRIDPYALDSALDLQHPLNHVVSGWSDKVPHMIAYLLQGMTQIDVIRNKIQL